MTVQAAIDATLPTLRAEAVTRMRSTALVERIDGVEPDPLTGADVESVAVTQAAVRCRVKTTGRSARVGTVAGATVAVPSLELHFPWDAPGLAEGCRVTITESDNPLLVGNRYRLVDPGEADQVTAQRWGAETWTPYLAPLPVVPEVTP